MSLAPELEAETGVAGTFDARSPSEAEGAQARKDTGAGPIDACMKWPAAPDILSLIADAIVTTDENGNIVLFNKAAEEMFGYGSAEVVGRPVDILVPPRLRQAHRRSVEHFAGARLAEGRRMGDRREVLGSRKNGEEFVVEASLSRRSVDGRALLTAVIRDATERKRIAEAQALLASELAHRFKNALAVVSSIVALTAKGATSVPAFAQALQGRLDALARTHDLLFQDGAGTADIGALILSELSPYQSDGSANVTLSGPAVQVSPAAAVNLGLALHELATNAAKYGALSGPQGKVRIEWQVVDAEGGNDLLLAWRETGGPPVSPPSRRGFGTELIKRCFGAQAAIDYARDGVHARIAFPFVPDGTGNGGEDRQPD